MAESWDDLLASLDSPQAEGWQYRHELAHTLIEALQTAQVVEITAAVRGLLLRLANDAKWEVRKVIANGLNLIENEIFDSLSARLMDDPNSFVKHAARQSYERRHRDRKRVRRHEATDRQLARQLQRIREKYGLDAARDIATLSEMRFRQLAGSMAHDLRSILTHLRPAIGHLTTVVKEKTDERRIRKAAERVTDGLAFIERCVGDMERYTEPLPAHRQAEDVAEVLRVACEMAMKNIEELDVDPRAVVLDVQVPDGLRLPMARHLIVLAISNLVKNAYESFMQRTSDLRAGRIVVAVTADEQVVQIVIRDDGMGMSASDLNELATAMPHRRNKAKRKSTGYGVPIARRYIEAHNGELVIESAEDVGTSVSITLPRRVQDSMETSL